MSEDMLHHIIRWNVESPLRKSIMMSRVGRMAVQLEDGSTSGGVSFLACAPLLADILTLNSAIIEHRCPRRRVAQYPSCGPGVHAPTDGFLVSCHV